ncbi:MAG: hypothetical protein WKF75_01575 [Singulisphaera sp.]
MVPRLGRPPVGLGDLGGDAAGRTDFRRAIRANVPFWDDWNLVPLLTGHRRISAAWLWELHNEHRIPLPKLALLASYKLSGNDFRSGMFFNVLALGVLAAVMILAARGLRGRVSCTDAFFPVILLHVGQYENYLISFTVNLVLPTFLAGVLLSIMTAGRTELTVGTAVLAGTCLISLPLCGGNGVVLVPALALWLGFRGVLQWRTPGPHGRRHAVLTLGFAAGAILLISVYAVDYRKPYYAHDPSSAGPRAFLRTSLQVLSVGFGPAVRSSWPWSGLVVLGLWVLSRAVLAKAGHERPGGLEPWDSSCSGAQLSLVLALGWGRPTGSPTVGFQSRYATLTTPALCCIYFIWEITARRPSDSARACLFGLACLMLVPNTREGLEYARTYDKQMRAFQRTCGPASHPSSCSALLGVLVLLAERAARRGPEHVARGGSDHSVTCGRSPFREVSLPVAPPPWTR